MWIQIVKCPKCGATKEIPMGQHRWKCPNCKEKHELADTLWRRVKKEG